MHRRVLAVLIALVAMCALAACGTQTVYVKPPAASRVVPETAITPEGARPLAPPVVNKQIPFFQVPLHINGEGLHLIEGFEGYSRCAYWDPYGRVYTVGFGQTKGAYAGFCFKIVHNDNGVTAATANLKRSIESEYEWAIRRLGVVFNQNQWNALCSFAYNLGAGIFTGTLRYDLEHKLYHAATQIMLSYDHAGGVLLAGLATRRRLEVRVFNTPIKSKPKPKPLTKAQKAAKLTQLNQLLGPYSTKNRRGHNCAKPPYRHAYPSARYNKACEQWSKQKKTLQAELKEKK